MKGAGRKEKGIKEEGWEMGEWRWEEGRVRRESIEMGE